MDMNHSDYVCKEVTDLISDMYGALQRFCEAQGQPDECLMWVASDRKCGEQCMLRNIEDRMRKLGFGDMVVE